MSIATTDFQGKRVLVRVDFNVPLNDQFEVTDDTRIRAALPTIQRIVETGGRAVLVSHLGRPKNGPEDKFSMRHVVPTLEGLLGRSVKLAPAVVGEQALAVSGGLQDGEVCLLENVRFHKEETAGDEFFAGQLAEHGDVYVNDAFGTAHREHASTAVVARFFPHAKMFGTIMESEIKNIDKVLHGADRPVTAIIGGAKVSSKLTIIEKLLDAVDNLFIGGGMAYTFIKAAGGSIGTSLVEDDLLDTAREVAAKAETAGVRLILPTDAMCADNFSNDANRAVHAIDAIPDNWMGLDSGPQSIETVKGLIAESRTILWNGPLGVFEMSNFATGTATVAQTLAKATADNGTFTLIGGGDSVAAINQFNLADKVSYVSTGGGAMLEYLEGKALPGIAAIRG